MKREKDEASSMLQVKERKNTFGREMKGKERCVTREYFDGKD